MKNKVTYFLLSINLIVFVLFNIRYGIPVCGDIPWRTFCINNFSVLQYGQVNSLLLEGKNLYQLITKLFLHKASFHLIWNVVALFYFGTEDMFPVNDGSIKRTIDKFAENKIEIDIINNSRIKKYKNMCKNQK